jgi:methylenetetrahydrofolate reductase (NADPH)
MTSPYSGAEFSFELFPPNSDQGMATLHRHRERLSRLQPRFYSVTYGAGGTTQERTFRTVFEIDKVDSVPVVPHLTCIGSTPDRIRDILQRYRDHGINRIVALRGDIPDGVSWEDPGHFRYAWQLVEFIRREHGGHFNIKVSCYPEVHPRARNADSDLDNFKAKIDAGANQGITQYFYNADAYFDFVDRCHARGVDVPIIPGIMPIMNYHQLARFSDGCGAEIPRWLRKRLEVLADDKESLQAFGVDVVVALCTRLLDNGAPGLHMYTLNQATATERIWAGLGLAEAVASIEESTTAP